MDRGGGINRFDAVGQRLMGNPLKAASEIDVEKEDVEKEDG